MRAWCSCASYGEARALKDAMAAICGFNDHSLSSGPVNASDMLFLCQQLGQMLTIGRCQYPQPHCPS